MSVVRWTTRRAKEERELRNCVEKALFNRFVCECRCTVQFLSSPQNRLLVVISSSQLANVDNNLHGLFHDLNRDELIRAVEVDSASEDVRAWETFEAELGAVRTATDGLYQWCHACLLHCFHNKVGDMNVRINLFASCCSTGRSC